MNKATIRDKIKAQRNALSANSVIDASIDISRRLWNVPALSRARRIACYFPVGHEVDCRYFISTAWEYGRTVLLPVLNGPELMFSVYDPNTTFLRNQHDIPEPNEKKTQQIKPQYIDVVLAPLVAFDATGNRVGMGGGYYDRSFRFMRNRTTWQHPKIIGVAYNLQKVPKIKACSWDIPLQIEKKKKKIYNFQR
jgi:5-formyltetrahydrofolate cyclo-ligase